MKPLSNDPALISSFAIFGIAATQIMNLSSVSSIIEIIRAGCTLCYPSFPFSVSIVASSTGIVYSIASNQLLVGVSSWLSVGQSTIYLGVHFVYSRDRSAIVRQLLTHSIVIGGSIGAGPLFACSFVSDCSSLLSLQPKAAPAAASSRARAMSLSAPEWPFKCMWESCACAGPCPRTNARVKHCKAR